MKPKTGRKRAPRSAPAASAEPPALIDERRPRPHFVVGVGASAGGLPALQAFFDNLSGSTGMAFVIVVHLDPNHASVLASLLGKHTTMPVSPITHRCAPLPNEVYVIPPNRDVEMAGGKLLLTERQDERSRRPIDRFFMSLAEDQGDRAIALVLSGMGADGSLGLQAIKAHFGMVMAQQPDSAACGGMPRSAIETRLVDFALEPAEMPAQLAAYANSVTTRGENRVSLTSIDQHRGILALLHSAMGNDFGAYQRDGVVRRIERRMAVRQQLDAAQYLRLLEQDSEEVTRLFRDLLGGLTSFFREPEVFEAIRREVLPTLLARKRPDESLRVWVPGCSTGEEAYSLAMVICEALDTHSARLNAQIYATDIDQQAIDTARAGRYARGIAADVGPRRRQRFLSWRDGAYCVTKELREMIVFAPQNLLSDPPFARLDLVCCRNLLNQLTDDTQERVRPLFHYALAPDGVLVLGAGESAGDEGDLFESIDPPSQIYRRADLQPGRRYPRRVHLPTTFRAPSRSAVDASGVQITRAAQQALLGCFAPTCMVISRSGEVLFVHGLTGRYLEATAGDASLNLFEVARQGLRTKLPGAVREAEESNGEVCLRGVDVEGWDDGGPTSVFVRPLTGPPPLAGTFLVSFEASEVPAPEPAARNTSPKLERRVKELEAELARAYGDLHTTVGALETSNEELMCTNEEMQSTSEELQASAEELQSVNAELSMVNAELHARLEELSKTTGDMKNLLEVINVPTVFVDNELNIRRFTSNIKRVFNLVASDVGRPIGHICLRARYDGLLDDLENVLRTLDVREVEACTPEGHWFLLRMMPYRTLENVVDGVVITFIDIHKSKVATDRVESLLAEARMAGRPVEGSSAGDGTAALKSERIDGEA